MQVQPFNPNIITVYDESLAHEPLKIELTEINGIKVMLFHNPGPILQKFREDRNMTRMIGIEEIDDLERGGRSREEALQEIWDKANELFRFYTARGYDPKEALELARKKDLADLDYLKQIKVDPDDLLRAERIKAFDQIERRERAMPGWSKQKDSRAESAHGKSRKKFHWPWQKKTESAYA